MNSRLFGILLWKEWMEQRSVFFATLVLVPIAALLCGWTLSTDFLRSDLFLSRFSAAAFLIATIGLGGDLFSREVQGSGVTFTRRIPLTALQSFTAKGFVFSTSLLCITGLAVLSVAWTVSSIADAPFSSCLPHGNFYRWASTVGIGYPACVLLCSTLGIRSGFVPIAAMGAYFAAVAVVSLPTWQVARIRDDGALLLSVQAIGPLALYLSYFAWRRRLSAIGST